MILGIVNPPFPHDSLSVVERFFYDRYVGRVNDHKGKGGIGNGNGERVEKVLKDSMC